MAIWHFLVKLFFSCAAVRRGVFSLCWTGWSAPFQTPQPALMVVTGSTLCSSFCVPNGKISISMSSVYCTKSFHLFLWCSAIFVTVSSWKKCCVTMMTSDVMPFVLLSLFLTVAHHLMGMTVTVKRELMFSSNSFLAALAVIWITV